MRRVVVLSSLVVSLVCVTGAAASHLAAPRTRAALRVAVTHSRFVPPAIRHGHFRLRRARISSVGPWAAATIVPTGAARHRLDGVLTILHRRRGHWRVAGLGTSGVGCSHPRLPRAVRRDLHLSCSAEAATHSTRARARVLSRRCRSVRIRAHGRATDIHAHNLACTRARRRLRGWLRHGFPRNEIGWYCDLSHRVKLCSLGNGGGAPYLTFRRRP